MGIRKIKVRSKEGQFTMILLASLLDLSDRTPSKREVEQHILKRGYLKLSPEYSKQAYDSKWEPRWQTDLAFARRAAIDAGLLKPLAVRDAWEISDEGVQRFAVLEHKFRSGQFGTQQFTFLSSSFLKRMGTTDGLSK